jgi:hypothetical protein
MKVLQLLLVLTALYEIGLAVPVPGPQLILPLRQHQPFFQRPNRPLLRPGGILSGLFGQQQQAVPATPAAAGVAAPPKTPDAVVTTPAAAPVVSPAGEVAAVPDAGSAPKNPGSLFTPGGSMGGSNTDINGRKKMNWTTQFLFLSSAFFIVKLKFVLFCAKFSECWTVVSLVQPRPVERVTVQFKVLKFFKICFPNDGD